MNIRMNERNYRIYIKIPQARHVVIGHDRVRPRDWVRQRDWVHQRNWVRQRDWVPLS